MKPKNLLVAAAIGLFISGCAASDSEVVTKQLTKSEMEDILIGKSYPLGGTTIEDSKGAFFFQSTSKLDVIWNGKEDTGALEINEDSSFCYNISLFGGRECVTLLQNVTEGGYVHGFDGERRYLQESAIVEGKVF